MLRISGPEAFATAATIAGRLPSPRRAALRALRDAGGALLDRAMVLVFPAPGTATGEDVVELHLHGGHAVITAVLEALLALPRVRLAEPGEFTRRAFDNGKLDLTQVEGLADLLAASTEAQRAQAIRTSEGALARAAAAWRDALLAELAVTEALLDFSDEGDVTDALPDAAVLEGVARSLGDALAGAEAGERLRDGLQVALIGAPNVGKSSLLNALAGREAAIVSPYAGTTRDPIEVTLDLGGVPVTLIDTAGLRPSEDPIEAEGIARAKARAASADLRLLLYDGGFPSGAEGMWLVRTKSDLAAEEIDATSIWVSTVTGQGIAALMARLKIWAVDATRGGEAAPISHARQRATVTEAFARVEEAIGSEEALLRAEALRLALRAIGRLSGGVDIEDVLDAIFARFCVGK